MNEEEAKRQIREALEEAARSGSEGDMGEDRAAAMLGTIYRIDRRRRVRTRVLGWSAVAAVLVAAVWGGGYLFRTKERVPVAALQRRDTGSVIRPGQNKAVLRLASGKTIVLDDAAAGNVADDGNARIVKSTQGGALSYRALDGEREAYAFNTITTPRGGQFQVNLADGSTVWLNASSSLRYPTRFTGGDRVVELTGEGYFQIAKRAGVPFFVKINGISVEVLGTSFNINGYEDEPGLTTTLVDGAVRVKAGEHALVLKPGQQAVSTVHSDAVAGNGKGSTAGVGQQAVAGNGVVAGGDALRLAPDADMEEVLAWKNGTFNFNRLDIATIMRQISRWYDVDVVYEGAPPAGHFSGIISRNTPVSTVLKLLEYGGVHFRVEGRKIVIMPG